MRTATKHVKRDTSNTRDTFKVVITIYIFFSLFYFSLTVRKGKIETDNSNVK